MKSLTKLSGILLFTVFLSLCNTQRASAQGDYVDNEIFYNELDPYGQWIDYPGLGQVWLPDAGSDFVPYSTNGHWVLTNYGWTWVSDYNWGWAPFHYGRWDFNNRYGWMWIPGYDWGPSWVSWRYYNGYYGWAPMGSGLSINISFGRQYNNPNDHWIFVRDRDFDRPNLRNYVIRDNNRSEILRNSQVIRRQVYDSRQQRNYISGPSRDDVQRTTGKSYNPVTVRDNDKPGQQLSKNELRLYRPKAGNTQTRTTTSRDVQQRNQSTPANTQRSTTVTNQRSTPVTTQRSTTVTNQRSTPANTQRSTTVTTQRSTPANTQRSTTVTNQRSTPANTQRSTTVTNQRSTPANTQRSTTVTNQRSTPANTQRSTPANTQRSTTVTNQRSTTVTNQRNATKSTNEPNKNAQKSNNEKSQKDNKR